MLLPSRGVGPVSVGTPGSGETGSPSALGEPLGRDGDDVSGVVTAEGDTTNGDGVEHDGVGDDAVAHDGVGDVPFLPGSFFDPHAATMPRQAVHTAMRAIHPRRCLMQVLRVLPVRSAQEPMAARPTDEEPDQEAGPAPPERSSDGADRHTRGRGGIRTHVTRFAGEPLNHSGTRPCSWE